MSRVARASWRGIAGHPPAPVIVAANDNAPLGKAWAPLSAELAGRVAHFVLSLAATCGFVAGVITLLRILA